ncbi:hypothetical protein EX30DRAFT_344978 [Ascodesmis nigricans]|uniref:Uncharacterized protein n=1 Tax=Ascodesmis nigricans TaxID=341454 RepID=A0A4S2MPR7_9PEZI|nr:hypothetical protein EX30DRAFT_344978 [Ascodesmis nigricans]
MFTSVFAHNCWINCHAPANLTPPSYPSPLAPRNASIFVQQNKNSQYLPPHATVSITAMIFRGSFQESSL